MKYQAYIFQLDISMISKIRLYWQSFFINFKQMMFCFIHLILMSLNPSLVGCKMAAVAAILLCVAAMLLNVYLHI